MDAEKSFSEKVGKIKINKKLIMIYKEEILNFINCGDDQCNGSDSAEIDEEEEKIPSEIPLEELPASEDDEEL